MPDDTMRWTVSVSKHTNIAVRGFLAQRDMKKGDLSKFIEEAVKWRALDQTRRHQRSDQRLARGSVVAGPPQRALARRPV
jgi:RNA polymerase-interacting CarD/CdnL/TRCF family regulator